MTSRPIAKYPAHLRQGGTHEHRQRANGVSRWLSSGRRATEDLVEIAAAARSSGGRVTFCGLTERPVRDLLKIVAAGGLWVGRVASSRG